MLLEEQLHGMQQHSENMGRKQLFTVALAVAEKIYYELQEDKRSTVFIKFDTNIILQVWCTDERFLPSDTPEGQTGYVFTLRGPQGFRVFPQDTENQGILCHFSSTFGRNSEEGQTAVVRGIFRILEAVQHAGVGDAIQIGMFNLETQTCGPPYEPGDILDIFFYDREHGRRVQSFALQARCFLEPLNVWW